MLFDQHELITANGAPCESFLFCEAMQSDMLSAQEDEIKSLFPEFAVNPPLAARLVLKRLDAWALRAV